MLLYELLSGLEYRLYGISGDADISRPFSDSKNCVFAGLFVCLQGISFDGHDYAYEVKKKGARACVALYPIEGFATVVVKDTRFALSVIWNNFYKRPTQSMRLFGITGTNGKTSTAAFLSACLKESGRRVGTIGTLGVFFQGERLEGECGHMTTPDPEYLYSSLAALRDMGATDVVMEVSSHSVVQKRVDALNFHTTVFTNLSPEHLDLHGTMEEYFRVKASFVSRGVNRIVNGDDVYGRRFSQKVPSVSVGAADTSGVSVTPLGVSYTFLYKDKEMNIRSCVGGDFTLTNTMLAAACAALVGVSTADIERGIASVKSIPGRLERVVRREDAGFDAFIDYAHTPAALEGVLLHLRRAVKGSLICVFGCGGERDREKRPLMGACAEALCDAVIVTGDNPRREEPMAVIRDIIKGMTGKNSVVIPDRREAIFVAVSMAGRGDILLFAGKGHENYEIVDTGVRPFDEKAIIKEAVRLKTAID